MHRTRAIGGLGSTVHSSRPSFHWPSVSPHATPRVQNHASPVFPTVTEAIQPSNQRTGHNAVQAAVQLSQTADSWGLEHTTLHCTDSARQEAHATARSVAPVVLLVDGTNLGCISAGNSSSAKSSSSNSIFRQTTRERFVAWLQFLAAVANSSASSTNRSSGPLAAVLVAFDNKGSALTNVRAQLQPNYLTKRYTGKCQQQQQQVKPAAVASRANVALSGWGELADVLEQLSHHHQQQQDGADHQKQQQPAGQEVAVDCQFLAAHAAYGFEADDVVAAAVQWRRQQLAGAQVVIASSDSDMQQLLDDSTYWLEMQQVASSQHPSGLRLHTAAAFQQEHGFPPAAYPDFLALVGKKEAGVAGVGLSAKLARTLLTKFGSLDGILASREALKAYGGAYKVLGQHQSGADARCAAAAANLAVLRMRPQQQRLPEQELRLCYSRTMDRLGSKEHHMLQQQQQRQRQEEEEGSRHLSLLHPARRLHVQQCAPYLELLQGGLRALGVMQQQAHWTSPSGLWCDLVVQLPATAAVAAEDADSRSAGTVSSSSSSHSLAFQILGPADLSAGAVMTFGSTQSYSSAVGLLGQQLAGSCGCYAQGTSALGHPKRSLLKAASGGAKRQLTLLKGLGMPVVVVPFFELTGSLDEEQQQQQQQQLTSTVRSQAGNSNALQYVQAVLKDHAAYSVSSTIQI